MIVSLVSEPFALEHGFHLTGTRSHPREKVEYQGFMDSWFHDTDRVPRGLDFFSIYQSGRNFLRGQSVYYGVREHRDGPEALVVPYFSGFRYLPIYAAAFGSALNILPPWPSYWAWILVVELLFVLNLYLTKWLPASPVTRRCIVAMWLAYTPYYVEIHIGQQSMVTVTLLHLAVIAHLNHRRVFRDTSYVMSVLWKLNTLLFLPIWIKLKRWKTIVVLLVLTVSLSAPYFALVTGSFQEFTSYFQHKFIASGPNSLGFWAFLVQILPSRSCTHASIRNLLAFWSLFVCLIATAVTLLPRKICFTRALCLWICVYFLTYQYVWEHHYVMILPIVSAGMLYHHLHGWTVALWLFCGLPTPYVLFNDPSLDMPQITWSLFQKLVYHGFKILPVLVFFVVLVFQLTIRGKPLHSTTGATDPDDQLDVIGIANRAWTCRQR